jgi:CheY-like chemotaxis protein
MMAQAEKKVLIVEDNDHWRKLLAMVIQRCGYQVIQATNGLEGVERAIEAIPDLILMDLGLPKMSGAEATAILKATPATKHIPVVIQTAYTVVENAVRAGAAEILNKPIELSEIQRVLAKYLSLNPAAAPSPHASARTNAAV